MAQLDRESTKRRIEYQRASTDQTSCADFPDRVLDAAPSRAHPDIVLVTEGLNIGIEDTELSYDETEDGSNEQSLAAEIEQTMEMATKMLRERNVPPLHVFVLLHVERGFRRDMLATKLVEYVVAYVPEEGVRHEVLPNQWADECESVEVDPLIVRGRKACPGVVQNVRGNGVSRNPPQARGPTAERKARSVSQCSISCLRKPGFPALRMTARGDRCTGGKATRIALIYDPRTSEYGTVTAKPLPTRGLVVDKRWNGLSRPTSHAGTLRQSMGAAPIP